MERGDSGRESAKEPVPGVGDPPTLSAGAASASLVSRAPCTGNHCEMGVEGGGAGKKQGRRDQRAAAAVAAAGRQHSQAAAASNTWSTCRSSASATPSSLPGPPVHSPACSPAPMLQDGWLHGVPGAAQPTTVTWPDPTAPPSPRLAAQLERMASIAGVPVEQLRGYRGYLTQLARAEAAAPQPAQASAVTPAQAAARAAEAMARRADASSSTRST